MNEKDLGSVAYSNQHDILNVMGASAAGDAEVVLDTQADSDDGSMSGAVSQSESKAKDSIASTVRTDLQNEGREVLPAAIVDDTINAVTSKARETLNGSNVSFQYDTKKHQSSSVAGENSLSISHNVAIDNIQIQQLQDNTGAIRGNYQYQDMNVLSNVTIRGNN
ncbi:MAG: hypothetical protein H6999_03375 [Hahellaceae bacterium]|nr:hypothetical protein [Hahellaceae bacterium]MCP5168779.1 hypothetical protein [Hahellaceae bacterium]